MSRLCAGQDPEQQHAVSCTLSIRGAHSRINADQHRDTQSLGVATAPSNQTLVEEYNSGI